MNGFSWICKCKSSAVRPIQSDASPRDPQPSKSPPCTSVTAIHTFHGTSSFDIGHALESDAFYRADFGGRSNHIR
jgi:hypothetical protein